MRRTWKTPANPAVTDAQRIKSQKMTTNVPVRSDLISELTNTLANTVSQKSYLLVITLNLLDQPKWGSWEAFGSCSVTCGSGTKKRTRKCFGFTQTWEKSGLEFPNKFCQQAGKGTEFESKDCVMADCGKTCNIRRENYYYIQ